MIPPTIQTLRLFLHVLAASVWVGGQIVLAGAVPRMRTEHPEALSSVARAFARVAWPAFAVALVTGIWNVIEVDPAQQGTEYSVTLLVKLLLVALAAVATVVHSTGRSRLALALGGAVGLVSSLAVVWLGVALSAGR